PAELGETVEKTWWGGAGRGRDGVRAARAPEVNPHRETSRARLLGRPRELEVADVLALHARVRCERGYELPDPRSGRDDDALGEEPAAVGLDHDRVRARLEAHDARLLQHVHALDPAEPVERQ